MVDVYKGFYTSRRFWAGRKPEFNPNNPKFIDIMPEIVYELKIDGNIQVLKICKDGMFMYFNKEINSCLENNNMKFEEMIDAESKYLKHINCIYFVFLSSFIKINNWIYFESYEMGSKDSFYIRFENNKFSSAGIPEWIGNKYIDERFSTTAHYDKTLMEIDQRIEISQDVIDNMKLDLEKIMFSYERVQIMADIFKSISEYKKGNFSNAIVLSWFSIEMFLNDKWAEFLQKNKMLNGAVRINKERMKELKKYNIATILNILELNGIISKEDYEIINQARKERNKIAHIGKYESINLDLYFKIFKVIEKFINEKFKTSIIIDTSLSIGF